ncbi:MAG: hypothetical protein IKU20_01640 [Lachnospiraceae bacterium]|nr:hypothetical protein [Lachnospiraceae bacterium]
MELLVGSVGFFLCFVYDWNRVFWKKKWMSGFFWIGCLCQVYVGVRFIVEAWYSHYSGWLIWLGTAFLFFIGLIYTLFFALPFDSTYCQEADQHKVCRTGIYGVCRHPGIWWFFGCFLCLGGACGSKTAIIYGSVLSFINLLYAWYQDKWIFPEEFSDYRDYQKEVPFLIPVRRR